MNFEKPKKSDSFAPLLTPKIKFGKNVKKTHEDIILLHMHTINQDHMIMVPEIWSVTDMIFYHLGQFFALLPP